MLYIISYTSINIVVVSKLLPIISKDYMHFDHPWKGPHPSGDTTNNVSHGNASNVAKSNVRTRSLSCVYILLQQAKQAFDRTKFFSTLIFSNLPSVLPISWRLYSIEAGHCSYCSTQVKIWRDWCHWVLLPVFEIDSARQLCRPNVHRGRAYLGTNFKDN